MSDDEKKWLRSLLSYSGNYVMQIAGNDVKIKRSIRNSTWHTDDKLLLIIATRIGVWKADYGEGVVHGDYTAFVSDYTYEILSR